MPFIIEASKKEERDVSFIKNRRRAKRGELQTVHGTIQTPVFMNVRTVAAIKGAVSTMVKGNRNTWMELINTYICCTYRGQTD